MTARQSREGEVGLSTSRQGREAEWQAPIPGAPHFCLAELTRSDTALRYGLDNRPGPRETARLVRLAREHLEPLRRRFGPLAVLSGYRSPLLNWYVSLSRASRHCRGEAADIRPLKAGVSLGEVMAFAQANLACQELILEGRPRWFIHLSCNLEGRPAGKLMLEDAAGRLRPASLDQILELGI